MMTPGFQRRVQRYGWDRAARAYEEAWQAQLLPAHDLMLEMARLQRGQRVLDVACGTGLVSFRVAALVGAGGAVIGTDLSGQMVDMASRVADHRGVGNATFERCDAEALPFEDGAFDGALCGLGLMYVPDPLEALREMRRVVTPGGYAAAAVWGARARCGWAEIFPITAARVASDVCPMFFHLGTGDVLAQTFVEAGFADIRLGRLATTLVYRSAREALAAAFEGGPVALAYSRFDQATKRAVHDEYLESIAAFRDGDGYRVPGEFVVASARIPLNH